MPISAKANHDSWLDLVSLVAVDDLEQVRTVKQGGHGCVYLRDCPLIGVGHTAVSDGDCKEVYGDSLSVSELSESLDGKLAKIGGLPR